MGEYLVMEVYIDIFEDNVVRLDGPAGKAVMIPFGGHAEGELFHGTVAPCGVDTQRSTLAGMRQMSARYFISGQDFTGKACSVFVENEGWFSDKAGGGNPFHTVPSFRTDSQALAPYLHSARFRGEGSNDGSGLVIRFYDTQSATRPDLDELGNY